MQLRCGLGGNVQARDAVISGGIEGKGLDDTSATNVETLAPEDILPADGARRQAAAAAPARARMPARDHHNLRINVYCRLLDGRPDLRVCVCVFISDADELAWMHQICAYNDDGCRSDMAVNRAHA